MGVRNRTPLRVRLRLVSSAVWLPPSCFSRLGREGEPGKTAPRECGRREGLFRWLAVRERGESRAGSPEPRVPEGRLSARPREGPVRRAAAGWRRACLGFQTFLLLFGC